MPVPEQPVTSITGRGTRHITISWSQPSGSFVDVYNVEYNASVRNCSHRPPATNSTMTSMKNFNITGLEEDSAVTVSITAANIGGSARPMNITTSTLTASKF